jgi:NAD-dependent SIR2 family protein deacetylase
MSVLSGTGSGTQAPGFAALAERVRLGGVVVLSGAGLSTESGIPDYRGPSGSLRRHTPMTYQEFTRDPVARHRYWARSYVGWPLIDRARPNDGHRAVAALQRAGLLGGIVTQNVDGLHQAAGATGVVELHGGLDRVVCQGCGAAEARADLGRRLRAANPGVRLPPGRRRGQPRRRRRPRRRGAGRLRHGRLPGLRRRPAEARRRVLR